MLFIGNFVPSFNQTIVGCFFWSWSIYVDFQLYLLLPIYVAIYVKSKRAAVIFTVFMMIAGSVACLLMADAQNYLVGQGTNEGYTFFAYIGNKPYFRLHTQAIGVAVAIFYIDLINYRKIDNEEEKRQSHPVIHWWIQRPWVSYIIELLSGGLIIFTLTDAFTAMKNPYAWSHLMNLLYYGFNKFFFVAGAMMLFVCVFMGHFNTCKHIFKNVYVRAMGKLTYICALTSTIVIMILYLGQDYSLYLSNSNSIIFGCGHIVTNLLVAFIFYIFIEYPIKTTITMVIHERSHSLLQLRYKLLRHFKEENKTIETEREFIKIKS